MLCIHSSLWCQISALLWHLSWSTLSFNNGFFITLPRLIWLTILPCCSGSVSPLGSQLLPELLRGVALSLCSSNVTGGLAFLRLSLTCSKSHDSEEPLKKILNKKMSAVVYRYCHCVTAYAGSIINLYLEESPSSPNDSWMYFKQSSRIPKDHEESPSNPNDSWIYFQAILKNTRYPEECRKKNSLNTKVQHFKHRYSYEK